MFDSKWSHDNIKLVALSALLAAVLAIGAKIIADYRREVNDLGPTEAELLEELRAAHENPASSTTRNSRRVLDVIARADTGRWGGARPDRRPTRRR